MDKDSSRYGSRDDEDSRLFTDEPPERTESRRSDDYGSRLFDDDGKSSPPSSERRGGLFSPDRKEPSLPPYDADPIGTDQSADGFDSPSSRESSGFRTGAGFGRGLERDDAVPPASSWTADATGRDPLLPEDGPARAGRRFSWEKDEPSDPAPQSETGRDYTAERAGVVSSRLDRLSSGMRQRLSERSYEPDRDAPPGSSYSQTPPAPDYDPPPRPAFDPAERPPFDPPARDERAFRDEPRVEDSYIPPEEPAPYQGYDEAPYRGAHARELADVDERYAREYQYDAEEAVGGQADYRDFDDEDYQQFEQPYGDYQPKSRAPFLIVGSLIGVAVIGAGVFYLYQQGVGESPGGDIPVIVGDDKQIKIVPDKPGPAEISSKTKLIYDRIVGEETQTEGTLVPREETPTAVTPNDQSQNSDGVAPSTDEIAPEPSKVVNEQIIPEVQDSTAVANNDGGSALPLPIPPPPSGSDTAQVSPIQPAPSPVPAANTDQTLGTGGNIVVPPANEPPAPATQERTVALAPPEPAAPTTQPALTTTQPALTITQEEPVAEPAPAPIAASPLAGSPPLPKEKPVPPSRQAEPGPAVPTGPIQIAPLPGSTARTATAPQAAAPAPSATAQAQTTTRRRSASRFSEEIAAPGAAFTSTGQDTQVATAPVEQPQLVTPAPAPVTPQQQAPVSDGRYLIQLASFRSQEEAQSEFDKLKQRHPSLIGEYASLIQQADLGTRGVYYRLRIGPIDSKQGASRLCNSLIAAGEKDCLVRQR